MAEQAGNSDLILENREKLTVDVYKRQPYGSAHPDPAGRGRGLCLG